MSSKSRGPQPPAPHPGSWEFIITREHWRFVEFCDACRRYRYTGLCYGLLGIGKTLSARHYAYWELIEPVFPRHLFELPPTARDLRTVLYTLTVANTQGQIAREVELACRSLNLAIRDSTHPTGPDERMDLTYPLECTELPIVDEADRLKMQGLEQMRDIYDRKGMGLVLIGMPGIEKRLARCPQLYSWMGFVHQYRPLSDEEMRFILERKRHQLGKGLRAACRLRLQAGGEAPRICRMHS